MLCCWCLFFCFCFLKIYSVRKCKNWEIMEYIGNRNLYVNPYINATHKCFVYSYEQSRPTPCSQCLEYCEGHRD